MCQSVFQPLKVGVEQVQLSHMQFSEDAVLFDEWPEESARPLMCLLQCFELDSRLKQNLEKSRCSGSVWEQRLFLVWLNLLDVVALT